MENSATLKLSVNPAVKRKAEEVLANKGMSISTAVDIYLTQISLTGEIPFAADLPKAPPELNMELMTDEELQAKLQKGLDDVKSGNVFDADQVFEKFRKSV